MEELKKKLSAKGWTEDEITKTVDMIYSSEKQEKHIDYKKQMNFTIYWMVILVLIVCNFLITVLLIPFLLLISSWMISFLIVVLGFVFGLIFDFLVRDIEHVERKHHIAAAVLIPILSIANIFIMEMVANKIAEYMNISFSQSPLLVSVLYVVPFLLPYLFSMYREARNKNLAPEA